MNTCAIPNCGQTIPLGSLMCNPHWAKVPRPIQIRVLTAWRARSRNQDGSGNMASASFRAGMDEYSFQRERAITAVEISEVLRGRREALRAKSTPTTAKPVLVGDPGKTAGGRS